MEGLDNEILRESNDRLVEMVVKLRSELAALRIVLERRDADLAERETRLTAIYGEEEKLAAECLSLQADLAAAQEEGANADDCIGRLHGQLDDAEAEVARLRAEIAAALERSQSPAVRQLCHALLKGGE